MKNNALGANAPTLPTVTERTEIIDGQVVRVESGFSYGAAPLLTREQIMAMSDAMLITALVAKASPASRWPQMIMAATELSRREAAEEFNAGVRVHSFNDWSGK